MTDPQNIVILIDNSDKSIDGDFYPNRLEAQKDTTEHLIKYYLKSSNKTQISIGTLGSNKIGIAAYLTNDRNKLLKAIRNIEPGGSIELEKGIKFAFLVLQHQYNEEKQAPDHEKSIRKKRIIVFVSSDHSLTLNESKSIQSSANRDKVAIDIVALGNDVKNIEILSDTVEKIKEKSTFLYADINHDLSDTVLGSPIGNGTSVHQTEFIDDPELRMVMEMSYLESLKEKIPEEDLNTQAAIRRSLVDQKMIEENKQKLQNKQEPNSEKTEKARKIDDDEEEEYSTDDQNDPDLQEAIEFSRQDCSNQNDQKSDDDSDETSK